MSKESLSSDRSEGSRTDIPEAVFESAPIASLVIDDALHIRLANDAAQGLLGSPDGHGLAGESIDRFFPSWGDEESDTPRSRFRSTLQTCIAGTHDSFAWTLATEDGQLVQVRIDARPVTVDDQDLIHLSFHPARTPGAGSAESTSPEPHGSPAADIHYTRHQIFFQQLFERTPEGVVILDNEDRILDANPAWLEMFAYRLDEVQGRKVNECIVPKERKKEGSALTRQVLNRREVSAETVRSRKDGSLVDVSILGIPIVIGGNQEAVYGIYRDISARKRAEAERQLAAAALENTADGIAIMDEQFQVISVNRAFSEITGHDREEILGKSIAKAGFRNQVGISVAEVRADLKKAGRWQTEVWNVHRDGSSYPALVSLSVVPREDERGDRYVCAFNDITESRQIREQLEFLAYYDPLTELPNRSLFLEKCAHALRRARRSGLSAGLMMIDLDQFKTINESLGHERGDEVIQQAANRLVSTLRDSDTVARLGGDEFVVLIEDMTSMDDLGRLADKIHQIFTQPLKGGEGDLTCTVSIGISCFPDDGADGPALIRNAEAAMYRAKEEGRNTYRFFSAEMNARVQDELFLTGELRQALSNKGLEVHYQPIVRLSDRELGGMEALVRWHQPERGWISPAEFIPLAERHGLINELGAQVIETVCHQVQEWNEQGEAPIPVMVNVSPRQFLRPEFLKEVHAMMKQAGIPPGAVGLEITETTMMQEPGRARRLLEQFSELGLSTAVDDFGTGYSSLSYLRDYPIHALKIDRSFVMGLPEDEGALAIVRAIIAMAHNLGLKVIAEGVETPDQAGLLRELDCDYAQGFYFSRPRKAAVIQTLMAGGTPLPWPDPDKVAG